MNNISLPDALRHAAEQQAARAGFKSADEYVADRVRRDLERSRSHQYVSILAGGSWRGTGLA